jgi:hypothetical protein
MGSKKDQRSRSMRDAVCSGLGTGVGSLNNVRKLVWLRSSDVIASSHFYLWVNGNILPWHSQRDDNARNSQNDDFCPQ